MVAISGRSSLPRRSGAKMAKLIAQPSAPPTAKATSRLTR